MERELQHHALCEGLDIWNHLHFPHDRLIHIFFAVSKLSESAVFLYGVGEGRFVSRALSLLLQTQCLELLELFGAHIHRQHLAQRRLRVALCQRHSRSPIVIAIAAMPSVIYISVSIPTLSMVIPIGLPLCIECQRGPMVLLLSVLRLSADKQGRIRTVPSSL